MVLGWLCKVTLTLSLIAVVSFDAISILTTRVGVSDDGVYAAREAAATWRGTHDVQAAYAVAVSAATEKNPANKVSKHGFRIDPDGTVHLRLTRTAKTWVVSRIDRTAGWAELTKDSAARPAA